MFRQTHSHCTAVTRRPASSAASIITLTHGPQCTFISSPDMCRNSAVPWWRIHVQGIEESLLFAVIKSIVCLFFCWYYILTTFNLCSIHSLHQRHGFIREEQWNTVSCCWLYRIARSNVLSLSPHISGKSLLFLLQHQGGSGIASIQWIPGYLLPTGFGIEARSSVRRVTIGQSKASRDRSSRDAFVEKKKPWHTAPPSLNQQVCWSVTTNFQVQRSHQCAPHRPLIDV